jgi:hypothetical protein
MPNDTPSWPIPPADAANAPERGGDGRYRLRKSDIVKGYVSDWACLDGPRFVAIVERDGDLWAVPARLI